MKFKNLKKRFVAVATAATLLASYTLPVANMSYASAETVNSKSAFELTIMHTNDTHSALDYMPKTATAVKQVRESNDNTLLLHAGDALTGTLYYNTSKGKADLAMLNYLQFDAMTFGNHEFDEGSSEEGLQLLADFIKGAEFPFVSANVDFSKDAKFDGIFNDSISAEAKNGQIYNGIIKEIDGQKVGIFGLTTEETTVISSPGKVTFENYLEEAEKAVQAFEEAGVNKIIALTHIGYDDNAAIDNDLVLAEKVEGIDVIVGGHSHTALEKPVVVAKDETPTVIVQAGNANNFLGVLNVEFDENGVIVDNYGHLIDIDAKDDNKNYILEDDPEAVKVLKEYKEKVNSVANEEIGVSAPVELENPRTNGDNSKPSVRKNETILGNLITDGMLKKAKEFTGKNVIMALQNGGGIRASIDAGPITVGEVITVLPFGNTLATMDVTGAELKEAFEISYKSYPAENGGFLHVSGGKVIVNTARPAGSRVIEVYFEDANGNYVPVKDDETYTVATNAFTAKGGDGYTVFAKAYEEGRVQDLGLSDWENFREHLESLKNVGLPTEIEGRQVDVKDEYITIMHMNDTHAALDLMPQTAKLVKSASEEALFLHAGDAFTGTLYFNEFYGKADLDLFNYMGFDAMTFGNHEFDLGSSDEGHQKLVEFIKGAKFPFVSANVDFSKDEKFSGLFNDIITSEPENGQIYNGIIKEVNGETVGIFGLTTEETVDISSPGSIEFENYLEEARKAVEYFNKKGVNRIIAVTHIGYDDNAAVDNDLILAKEVEGIDVIVGGHSHTTLSKPVVVAEDATPTIIVQTGNANNNLGVLDVKFDENGVIEDYNGELIEINDKMEADAEALEILRPYKEQVDKVTKKEIGVSTPVELENPRTNGDDSKPSVRKNETILGNLITDGMLAKAREFTGKDVTFAFQNGGGIRSAIDQGPITVGEVINVLPFGNTLAVMDLTGAELKEAMEISVGKYPSENGGFLHLSGGKLVYDATKSVGERVVELYYQNEQGYFVPVKDAETYTVATNAFTAKGGDGYTVFAKAYEEGRVTDLGLSDWENFRDHLINIGSKGIPTEIEGRIINLDGKSPSDVPGALPVQPEDEEGPAPGDRKTPGTDEEKTGQGDKQQSGNKEQLVETVKAKVKQKDTKYIVTTNPEELKDKNVVVEVSTNNKKKVATVVLSKEQIDALNDNAFVVITNGDVFIEIPASVLKANGKEVEITVKEMKVEDSSALAVYDFTILAGDKEITKFDNPITLTFKVDSSKVKNPEHIKVYYYNEAKDKWELVGGEYNPETGEITVETNHFSIFGVFEVASVDQAPKGKPLPNTATMAFNTMAVGATLIVLAGGLLFFINRRKSA